VNKMQKVLDEIERIALEPMQDIFDAVAVHLMTQGCSSENEKTGGCLYKGPRGKMCAIGCLLESVDTQFVEGNSVYALMLTTDPSGVTYTGELLVTLQTVHDDRPPHSWYERLTNVANSYGLNTDTLDLFKDTI
jgi:hypothetical protein